MKTKLKLLILVQILLLLMSMQVLFYAYSIYQIINGSIYIGIFNMTLQSAFFVVNIYSLKRVLRNLKTFNVNNK
jgi:hypothetical protein